MCHAKFLPADKLEQLLDRWQRTLTEQRAVSDAANKVKMLLSSGGMLFYFEFEGDIYGSDESGRVTFAKLKDQGDEDNTEGWRKEAGFVAQNLSKAVVGQAEKKMFTAEDMKDVHVLPGRDAVETKLLKLIGDPTA
mgnify:CR=1 FL=1